jgi:CubicO group peptidase (beta-lactamase class C family)
VLTYDYPWVQPNVSWKSGNPQELGFAEEALGVLTTNLAERRTRAFLVAREGEIAHEWYSTDTNPNRRLGAASVSKAVVGGMALWVALSEGLIDLDDPAWKYIPEWKDNSLKSQVTIRHLAGHSSGLSDPGHPAIDLGRELEPWEVEYWEGDLGTRFSIAIHDAPIEFEPGSRVAYSTPGWEVLAYVMAVSLQHSDYQDLYTLLRDQVKEPLEIPSSDWSISYGESYQDGELALQLVGGGGAYTARALARMGELVLRRGEWQGEHIADSNWLDEMLTFSQQSSVTVGELPAPTLGGWWSNANGTWPSLPEDAIAAVGAHHRVLLVVPSLDLIAVRLGGGLTDTHWDDAIWKELEEFLFRPIMETMHEYQQD